MTQLTVTFNTRGRAEATALLLHLQELAGGDLTMRRDGTFTITEPEEPGARLAAGMIVTISGTYPEPGAETLTTK